MGKTGVSCLSIMSCGRDRAEEDESGRPEAKPPLIKHRWSFKRRSSKRQTPDDSVISEPMHASDSNKGSPQGNYDRSHLPTNSNMEERLTVAKCLEDTPPLSPPLVDTVVPPPLVDTVVSDLLPSSEDNKKPNDTIPEHIVVVIQSAVRAYLAGRDLAKRKSVIKLQAAVRGHLARRQAISTLRCVQAIIKMQTLVRARRMRLNVESLTRSVTGVEVEHEEINSIGMDSFSAESADQKKYSSTEVSLRNGFARLLLNSKPKTKPVYISCDPLKSDSAWKWLERWMAAGFTKNLQEDEEQNDVTHYHNEGSNLDTFVMSHVPSDSSTSVASSSTTSKSDLSSSEGKIKASGNGNLNPVENTLSTSQRFQGTVLEDEEKCHASAEMLNREVHCHVEKNLTGDASDPISGEMAIAPDLSLGLAQTSTSMTKIIASDISLDDSEKPAEGAKISSSLELPDAKSNYEELSLVYSNPTETCISQEMTSQGFILECGAEAPSSAAVNSHDVSQQINKNQEPTTKSFETKDGCLIGDPDNACCIENTIETEEPTSEGIQEKELSEASSENNNIEVFSITDEQRIEQTDERTDISLREEKTCKSSPDTSPRSHINAAESIGTPSSQVSASVKISTSSRGKLPHRKPKTKLSSKKSPADRNAELNKKIASDLLPENSKNGYEDNSSMTGDLDESGQECRASVSKSVPSYMQTTESARAKFHSSNSPRASYDENGKERSLKKRHSLPTGSGSRESSSHSQSQVQHSSKGNAAHSAQNLAERKWVR